MVLSKGNKKLDKGILGWSITPVESCLNCGQCAKNCYARFPYRMYPKTKIAWDRNFELAKTGAFSTLVIDQLNRTKKCTAVRIHVAGDFFSREYILNWVEIVKTFPDLKFYGYSKVFEIFPDELFTLTSFQNCNIINSIAPDGGVNFGDEKRIVELQKMGYRVCPATKKDGGKITCGKDCTLCITTNKVCFHLHR